MISPPPFRPENDRLAGRGWGESGRLRWLTAGFGLVADRGPAGRMLRVVLPATFITILLSGLLLLGVHRLGYVGTAVGGAIFAVVNVAAVALAVLRAAWLLQGEYRSRRQTEDEVRHHAIHDPVTGLANRGFFLDQLARRAALAERRTSLPFAVCSLEVDGFSRLADQLGADAGKQILVKVADVIRECVRASDLVARLDGEKFGILLEEIADARDVDILAQRIVSAIPPALSAISGGLPIMVNIGVVLGSTGNLLAGDMLRDAESALQLAKKQGPGRFELTAFAD